mgnify:CR=1 FL=1
MTKTEYEKHWKKEKELKGDTMNAVMLVEDGCRHKVLWSGE